MATLNVYLPDALKVDMDSIEGVNWSQVAQEAFRRTIQPERLKQIRAEDEAFAQVAEKQGPFRPRAPDPSPEARLARLERKLAKLTGRLDDMETGVANNRMRGADVADRMASANAALDRRLEEAVARIAMLEARLGPLSPGSYFTPPYRAA